MKLKSTFAAPLSDTMAAELVLGVLPPAAHFKAKARLNADVHFAEAYDLWSMRLAPLALTVRPASPSQDLWPRIRRRLLVPAFQKPIERWFWRATTPALVALASGLAMVIARQNDLLGARCD